MTYAIKLTSQAQSDLEGIVEYTYRQWGAAQLEAYLEGLHRTIDGLKENPQRQGRALDELRRGLRYVRHQQHYFIFYRVERDRVEVLRIIHQRRDWRRLLRKAE
jgi:toxin ParE1/3/4